MRPRLRSQYPSKSSTEIDRVAAGIWHGQSDSTKQRLTNQLEGKAVDMHADDDEYWDGIIQRATNPHVTGSSPKPNVPDTDVVEMGYGLQQKGLEDPQTALEVIDSIADIYADKTEKQQKEEARRMEEQEAPIDQAMQLPGTKEVYQNDDNPAQESMRNEDKWGERIRAGQEDDRSSKKPVIASVRVPENPTEIKFNPPLINATNVMKAIEILIKTEPKMNEKQKRLAWYTISKAARNVVNNVHTYPSITKFPQFYEDVLTQKRVMYELEQVKEKMYELTIPLWRVQVKSAVKCKDPDNCEDPAHDHQYYVEGFVTTPVKDLQGEVVKESTFKEITDNITQAPHNLGWLHHESPYAAPEKSMKTPPIIRYTDSKVQRNPINNKVGVWVRGLLNKAHPQFRQTWQEAKNGFLNAFSMEFVPLHEGKEWVRSEGGMGQSKPQNFVDQIKYLSTSLVRAPANEGAIFTRVYAKSFQGLGYRDWSRSATAGHDKTKNEKGEMKMSERKDLGRETGTTAPERSNTAIGEWGDPTLEKGQAQMHDAQDRAAALNKLNPRNTPFHPSPRRATGAAGKAAPEYYKPTNTNPAADPSQVEPNADEETPSRPRPARSAQKPEDYKAVRREEEEGGDGFSYQPSSDSDDVESDKIKFEEEEEARAGVVGPVQDPSHMEEEEEGMKYAKAYKAIQGRLIKNRAKDYQGCLRWLSIHKPNLPLAQAMKAAGEMTECLGEVNAPQKIDKEQIPPEVEYGKYGSPDMPAPLGTFGVQAQNLDMRIKTTVNEAVAAVTEDIAKRVETSIKQYAPVRHVISKGYGAEQVIRDPNVGPPLENPNPNDIEGMTQQFLRRQIM